VKTLKKLIKDKSIKTFNKFLTHEDTSDAFTEKVKQIAQNISIEKNVASPYYTYLEDSRETSKRDDMIFITGRFRSGSSVFWNVFRAQDKCTAYYEPFNERRWFDIKLRGNFVDKSHKGVNEYWAEYDDLPELANFYDEEWTWKSLHMDKFSFNPNMKKFIDILIEKAKGRAVLQFNRVDFRLPWLRKQYPNAKILHIYRNPRDQWLSFLTNKKDMNANDVQETYIDAFYLNTWCKDLSQQFPFLSSRVTPHPYMRFYYLWKLSLMYGYEYSDSSISLEELVSSPEQSLKEVKASLNWETFDVKKGASVIQPIQIEKWPEYAISSWFEEKESVCESELNRFFGEQS